MACSIGLFAGCSSIEKTSNVEVNESSFVIVESIGTCNIYVCKETKVMYMFIKIGNGAGLTVMLNADGTPMIYDGEL